MGLAKCLTLVGGTSVVASREGRQERKGLSAIFFAHLASFARGEGRLSTLHGPSKRLRDRRGQVLRRMIRHENVVFDSHATE